ncbi:uncharacterized protein LOC110065867 isoform X1 [Orbicella faveolata]|uniref:uncharacterized protein LOC110065867 isoform X1 n=1 Tax=Orbicella faveolata TaxID=48498 RepID=UPI0009E58EE5|nr:uncharacterized protein LOC110065867 isoform X1 [Orbicella faveolata]
MVTVVECGTQVDIRNFEICTCASVAVQVEPGDFQAVEEVTKFGDGSPLLTDAPPSTEVVIEEGSPPQYRCDYCFGCLFCERGHAWYSIHGKGTIHLLSGYLNISIVKCSPTFVSGSKSIIIFCKILPLQYFQDTAWPSC